MNLVDKVNQKYVSPLLAEFPDFKPGDEINVHVKITEGAKTRIQQFHGTCIAIKEKGKTNGHFRVRKISAGMGVERVFPYHSPNVAKIELINVGKVRRAKHFYLRDRLGKGAKIDVDFSAQ